LVDGGSHGPGTPTPASDIRAVLHMSFGSHIQGFLVEGKASAGSMRATAKGRLGISWDSLFGPLGESGGSVEDTSNSEAHFQMSGLCKGLAIQHCRKRFWRFIAMGSLSGAAGSSPVIIFLISANSFMDGMDAYGIKPVRIWVDVQRTLGGSQQALGSCNTSSTTQAHAQISLLNASDSST
jgi:hypothetical protein